MGSCEDPCRLDRQDNSFGSAVFSEGLQNRNLEEDQTEAVTPSNHSQNVGVARLKEWITKALTKTVWTRHGKRRELKLSHEPPSERLVMITEFSMAAIAALTIIEVVHIVVLGSWNSEIFAAMTGLIGTVTGLFVGAKT